jgi:hypothetical protein
MSGRKDALLQRIDTDRARLDAALARLSDDELQQPGFDGEMSVKDLLAHIAAWEQLCIGWIRAGQRGDQPDRPDQYTPEGVDRLNADIYARNRDRPLPDVRADFDRSFTEIRSVVESLTEKEIGDVGAWAWTGERSLEVFISANADFHYKEHAEQLERWIERRD